MKTADIEMKERKALAGSTTTMSYHTKAAAELALEAGNAGRWTDKAALSGREPFVKYPRQGPESPWSSDLSGVEPPFGIDVGFVEPCGTPVEVEESLRLAASLPSPSKGDAVATAVVLDPAVGAGEVSALDPLAAGTSSLLRGRKL
jgi:hypothetical protein